MSPASRRKAVAALSVLFLIGLAIASISDVVGFALVLACWLGLAWFAFAPVGVWPYSDRGSR